MPVEEAPAQFEEAGTVEEAAAAVEASLLVYVPAGISPHKLDTPPTDSAHRLSMLHLVVDGIDGATGDGRARIREERA